MACHNRGCLGKYNFDQIVAHARKRFIEGIDTISLLNQAKSEAEKEEIAIVCLLSVEDGLVKDIQVNCRYANTCKLTNCRDKLRKMLENELAVK